MLLNQKDQLEIDGKPCAVLATFDLRYAARRFMNTPEHAEAKSESEERKAFHAWLKSLGYVS